MMNYKKLISSMKNLKKTSSLLLTLCVFQWSVRSVGSAITAGDRNSKSTYARTDEGRAVAANVWDSIYHKSRQSRCVTCYDDRRYGDDRSRYYSGYAARAGDDRWSYPSSDRYDDHGVKYDSYRPSESNRYGVDRYHADHYGADHYGADRYVADRYGADRHGIADRFAGYRDDPYAARPSYERYDSRTRGHYERPAAYDSGESRGYGYGNRDRDRYYDSDRASINYYGRDRYYDRPRYGAGSTAGYGDYDRDYYDRFMSRGQSGYGSTGRGSYYAQSNEDRRYLPEPGYAPPASSRCGLRKPNCPYDPLEEGTRVSSGTIDSGHYNVGVSQTTYSTNSNTNHNESVKGSGSSAGWSYLRENEQPPSRGVSSSGSYTSSSNNINRGRSSDQQSSGYGALLDRGSNLIAVEAVKSNENANDSMPSRDVQKEHNGDETQKKSDNEQNS